MTTVITDESAAPGLARPNGRADQHLPVTPPRGRDALPLALLPVIALALRPVSPAWAFMWAMALALFLGCKWLTWRTAALSRRPAEWWKSLAYLLAWPGMNAREFLDGGPIAPATPEHESQAVPHAGAAGSVAGGRGVRGWCAAGFNLVLGAALVWGVARRIPAGHPEIAGWCGLVGLAFVLHFGVFRLTALLWQQCGINARPIMRAPFAATSLAEFWGQRWNTAFHELAHTFGFRPLRRIIGPKAAVLAVFFISGVIHELVISLPAGGGYGLPTAYFMFQAIGLLIERTALGRRLGLGAGLRGWTFAAAWTAGPAFWLFHPPFVHNVILPFLHEIGAN